MSTQRPWYAQTNPSDDCGKWPCCDCPLTAVRPAAVTVTTYLWLHQRLQCIHVVVPSLYHYLFSFKCVNEMWGWWKVSERYRTKCIVHLIDHWGDYRRPSTICVSQSWIVSNRAARRWRVCPWHYYQSPLADDITTHVFVPQCRNRFLLLQPVYYWPVGFLISCFSPTRHKQSTDRPEIGDLQYEVLQNVNVFLSMCYIAAVGLSNFLAF